MNTTPGHLAHMMQLACDSDNADFWQVFARGGNIVSAIRALRDRTGMGLKDAKDVIEHWVASQLRPRDTVAVHQTTVDLPKNNDGSTHRVLGYSDGSFVVEATQRIPCSDLRELLLAVAKLSSGGAQG